MVKPGKTFVPITDTFAMYRRGVITQVIPPPKAVGGIRKKPGENIRK